MLHDNMIYIVVCKGTDVWMHPAMFLRHRSASAISDGFVAWSVKFAPARVREVFSWSVLKRRRTQALQTGAVLTTV